MRVVAVSRWMLSLSVCAGVLAACPASNAPRGTAVAAAGEPIARIGDTTLTVEQIQARLDAQSPFVRARYMDPAHKREFLDSQVRFEVLAAEAFARGLDRDPEVLDATKKIIVQKLTRQAFESPGKVEEVSDAELQRAYEAHRADYQKPAMVRASALVIAFGPDAASKQKAKASADDVRKRLLEKPSPEAFKEQVAKHSTDEDSKRANGDLRYLSSEEAEQKLGTAAKDWLFASETIDELSPVLEGGNAYLVLKRTGRRKEVTRTFEQVKSQLKNVAVREKRAAAFEAFVQELKQKHGVTVFEDKLERVKVNVQMPPSGVAGSLDPHGASPSPAPVTVPMPSEEAVGSGATP